MSSHIEYLDMPLQEALNNIIMYLKSSYAVSGRTLALLLLQEDPYVEDLVQKAEGQNYEKIKERVQKTKAQYSEPLRYVITMNRQKAVDALVSQSVSLPKQPSLKISNFLSRLMIQPLTGYPMVALILYYGLYQFVGVFGGGTVVDFIETTVFETHINPWAISFVQGIFPWKAIQDLWVGEYGIFTLGVRYAIAIVLPIVGTFFIAFSMIEDSGYLPRLALLLDRSFKKIGLNGRAVIPMVLGLGCDTMATMVTRILETKREKVIATLLLALAIPCSAQLGLILALLSSVPSALLLWSGVVIGEFFLIGYLTAKLLPGQQPQFFMELPPLRLPLFSNVLSKTFSRIQWYFMEVLPLFIVASILIWAGQITGLFGWVIEALKPLVISLGLPPQAAVVILFGFFRRDYGAAGLFDLQSQNLLTHNQLIIAAVTLTLFLPCIAQFLIMKKERGLKTTLLMTSFIFVMAFGTGFLLNFVFNIFGIVL